MQRIKPPYWVLTLPAETKPEYETNDSFMSQLLQMESEDPNWQAAIDWAEENDVRYLEVGYYDDLFVVAPVGFFRIGRVTIHTVGETGEETTVDEMLESIRARRASPPDYNPGGC